jgi:glycosyltransferase involved in cell wall biosynthesis
MLKTQNALLTLLNDWEMSVLNKRKLLFITTRLFNSPDSGRKVSLYHYCRGLHDVYGYEIYQYSFLESGQKKADAEKRPPFIKEIITANGVDSAEKFKNLITLSLLGKRLPFQCSLYYSTENEKRVAEYIEKVKPDVILVDMIRLAQYVSAFENCNALKIFDCDDLLSKRYERQIQNTSAKAHFAGMYSNAMPSGIKSFLNLPFVKNAILKAEIERLKNWERKFAEVYDKTILVSDAEAAYLNEVLGERKAHAVPIGIDTELLSRSTPTNRDRETLSFVGNFNVAANIDSLDMIVHGILPLIEHKVTVKVIGSCPKNISEKYSGNANVKFTGFVDDLQSEVTNTAIFLSPIAYGSGIKTKILEAMGMTMPVVTNSIGAESISAENGKHFFIYDDYAEIARCVDDLLDNPENAMDVAENGYRLVTERYNWQDIWKKFKKMGL